MYHDINILLFIYTDEAQTQSSDEEAPSTSNEPQAEKTEEKKEGRKKYQRKGNTSVSELTTDQLTYLEEDLKSYQQHEQVDADIQNPATWTPPERVYGRQHLEGQQQKPDTEEDMRISGFVHKPTVWTRNTPTIANDCDTVCIFIPIWTILYCQCFV